MTRMCLSALTILSTILPGGLLLSHFIDRETETQRKELALKSQGADASVLELQQHLALVTLSPVAWSMPRRPLSPG